MRSTRNVTLAALTPWQQLRAGRLGRRLVQLVVGLFLFGFSMAMMLRASLGIAPWDVLHQGLHRFVPLTFGQTVVAVSVVVLLLWIPLRQWPGVGTVANAVLVGVFVDVGLVVLPTVQGVGVRVALLIGGVVVNGVGGAIYIGAQLGAGARDGLMTGLVARTGRPVWLVRTAIEVIVAVIGFLLGGDLWLGTVLYAVAIGWLVQLFLPLVTVRLPS